MSKTMTQSASPPSAGINGHSNGHSKTKHPESKPSSSSESSPPPPPPSTTLASTLDLRALFYMFLLAVQFGIQPLLVRLYTPKTITRSTVILTQEVMKFVMAAIMLETSGARKGGALKDWTISSWVVVALLPSFLYAIQNLAALLAYQTLDAFTFNVLNQTKTLSAAFCVYLIMNKPQSKLQIVALLLLLLSACVMEGIITLPTTLFSAQEQSSHDSHRQLLEQQQTDDSSSDDDNDTATKWGARHYTHGVAPILLASFLSGLAGALSQKNLQAGVTASGKQAPSRNSYLFSMELCAGSTIVLLISLLWSEDGHHILEHGFWHGWTLQTLIPIATNAAGGIIVGLVTKYAGSVQKGFALIFGILFSALFQAILEPNQTISTSHMVSGCLAAFSLYLHASFPPARPVQKATKQD